MPEYEQAMNVYVNDKFNWLCGSKIDHPLFAKLLKTGKNR